MQESYKITAVGKNKFEAYTRYKAKRKSRKIVFVSYPGEIFVITGAEKSLR